MDINWKHIAIALAVIIVISWTHCYNRIADLEAQRTCAGEASAESTGEAWRHNMISIEQLTKAQQQSPQDERGASLLVPESTAEGRLEQHIAKIISLPSKNIFGQPYVPLQEVFAWHTKALAIVKELKDA